jgi:hypothetical protein
MAHRRLRSSATTRKIAHIPPLPVDREHLPHFRLSVVRRRRTSGEGRFQQSFTVGCREGWRLKDRYIYNKYAESWRAVWDDFRNWLVQAA